MAKTMLYRVEFYDAAGGDKNALFSFNPTLAPYAFAVGDFVDPVGWSGNPLAPDEHYKITAVEHQLTDPDGESGEAQHNIVVSVEAVPRNVDKSAASV